MKKLKYYNDRFKQIPPSILSCQLKRNRWVVETLDKNLNKPSECGIGFFHFLVAKCIEIGQPTVDQLVSDKISLYKFFVEHENRKKRSKEARP